MDRGPLGHGDAMQRQKALREKQRIEDSDAMRGDTPGKSQGSRIKAIEFRILELDTLRADVTKRLAELETAVARKREAQRTRENTLENMSRSAVDHAMETRCRNLRETLNTIQRARLAAQIDLAIALQG